MAQSCPHHTYLALCQFCLELRAAAATTQRVSSYVSMMRAIRPNCGVLSAALTHAARESVANKPTPFGHVDAMCWPLWRWGLAKCRAGCQ